jgi:hypothetical protein
VIPTPPAIPDAKQYHKLGDGTLGEFDFRVLIQQYVGKEEAASLSPHALGGIYQLFETKHDHHPVLTIAVNWDTPAAAQQFLTYYRKALKGKSNTCEFTSESAAELSGRNDQGVFRVRINEGRFESLEGLPAQLH